MSEEQTPPPRKKATRKKATVVSNGPPTVPITPAVEKTYHVHCQALGGKPFETCTTSPEEAAAAYREVVAGLGENAVLSVKEV